ncbi:glycosyltransferase family 2 protein [Xenorhabdus innexi]|uniref:Glycosyltransferases involved in cell wall biogenesis n=1 Tax=Xenorhabdus innexi TaxID=290109 RepID=A0A1N6MV73_9GAMM|nr:glycosyltransferase [Xenorhabdus innexi]PHM30138.1 Glycosyltransferases involved in cell wall biogenesis [Xenorhabdus innexi]SIP72712.1 WenB [Xenorhabdus innexi]
MSKDVPKISVIMSVFNGCHFLSEAVESILNQSFYDYEFIIVNDASTDNTDQVLFECQQRDHRIKIINNLQNIGLAASLNIAISASRGEFIARMDADDYSFPDRLKKQYEFMVKHADVIVCGTAMSIYEEPDNNKIPPLSHEEIISRIAFDCPFYHPTVMMRKSVFLKFGIKYPENYKRAQDYGLWVSLFLLIIDKDYRFTNLPDVLLKYRVHPDKVREKHYNEQMLYSAESQFKLMSCLGIKVNFNSLAEINLKNKLSGYEVIRLSKVLKIIAVKIMQLLNKEDRGYVHDILIAKKYKLYSRAKINGLFGILLKLYSRFFYFYNRRTIKSFL